MDFLMMLIAPVVNFFIDLIYIITIAATFLLPDTPFNFTPLDWGLFGRAIGFIFPVGDMATHLVLILGACLTYYAVRQLLRLVKAVR